MVNFFIEHTITFTIAIAILGLIVGSFLNVVIHRLPIMLQKSWRHECITFLEIKNPMPEKSTQIFNLAIPRSHCPHCNKPITAWDNIPLLSYIFLKGQCRHCHRHISFRYPLVELISGIVALLVAAKFGYSWQTAFALCLTWSLIALFFIDLDTHLLPDSITLPLIWLGLIANIFNLFTDLNSAVIGAVSGYTFLWLITNIYKLLTKRVGMGNGDFKLLAAMGAWLGWQIVPFIILCSSIVGLIFGIAILLIKKQNHQTPIAFGPYLAIAGYIALLSGNQLTWLF